MDIKKFVADLVAGGVDKKAAEAKVKSWVAKTREKYGEDVTDEKIAAVISQHLVKMKLNAASGEKFTGVCVGYGRKKDWNAKIFEKFKLIAENAQMPGNAAIIKKLLAAEQIKEVTDDNSGAKGYAFLDNREFIDKAGKIQNFGFGKPLRHNFERPGYFIIDNEIVEVVGDFDAQIGREYQIYGKKKTNGQIRVGKSGISSLRTLSKTEVWGVLYDVAAEDPRSVSLDEMGELKPYTFGITNAFVKSKMQCSNGGWRLGVYDADNMKGVTGFAGNEDVQAVVELSEPATEVILLFIQGQAKGEWDASPSWIGMFTNPEATSDSFLDDDVEMVSVA
jgi:hypothetical protein